MAAVAFVPATGWARAGPHTGGRRLGVGGRPPLPSRPVATPATPARRGRPAATAGVPAAGVPPVPVVAGGPPAPPPGPTPAALLSPPPALWKAAAAAGAAKTTTPTLKLLLLAVAGGAYIALGGLLALSVGGACPGLAAAHPGLAKLLFAVVGLPTGLTMVLVTGAELFTGNVALCGAAALGGGATWAGALRNWALAYVGNFVGSLGVVALVAAAGTLTGPSAVTAMAVAGTKAGLAFWPAFWRGVGCNWLVCLAVWMAAACRDFGGKALAALIAVSAFVVMGFEHSVANMFLIPMGMVAGAPVSVQALLLGNLLPVTLGNIVGGLVLVAALAWATYGSS